MSLNKLGIVGATAPEQVVRRVEELGLVENWSSGARRALMVAAHFGYGTGAGAVFGVLRREEQGEIPKQARSIGASKAGRSARPR
jgi:hypothetical protein